jgi:hypothetical protein
MYIYQSFVFQHKLVSPVNGYECKRITKQNIKQFGFSSTEELHQHYPDFPLLCEDCHNKVKNNFKKGREVFVNNVKNKVSDFKTAYELKPNTCHYCNSILSFNKRSNKFCNQSCSGIFSNKNRTRTKNPHKTIKIKKPKVKQPIDNSLLGIFKRSGLYVGKSPNLIKLGFNFNNQINEEFTKIKNMLYTEYHVNNESLLSIMKKYNIPSTRTMDILFRVFDIKTRGASESQILSYEEGRSNIVCRPFITIYHKAWYGETVILRSTYEEEYAKLLDAQKIMYYVEHFRIKYLSTVDNTYHIAIPDFYLPESNTIVEVKATYWLDEQNMRDKKKAYLSNGYNFWLNLDNNLIHNW